MYPTKFAVLVAFSLIGFTTARPMVTDEMVTLITEVGIRQSTRIDQRRQFPALDTRSPNNARALTIDVIEPVDEANVSDLDGPWVTPRLLDRGPAPFTESVLDPTS
ncbi:hypothetical protein B0H13DRAFT_2353018 [Mycena leptocephala]|nr:hypothetical protein B0H13DRAFT_2353018 [Mycena leptocephala]